LDRTYVWPYQLHASIGPSCAVAEWHADAQGQGLSATVWAGTQNPHVLRADLAKLTGLPDTAIDVVRLEASGCYGRNGHEDATADAAMISVMMGKPVRVQWMRADETARAPKSPPRAIDMEAGFDANGKLVAWSADFHIALNHIAAFKPLDFPLLAATDIGQPKPGNWVGFLFQNSAAPYQLPNIRVNTRHVAEAFFRSSHLRSPGRIENSFANESFMDELAVAAKADPAEFRLQHMSDPRALAVMRGAMKLANWQSRTGLSPEAGKAVSRGRGISYVRYNNATTYVAAIAEVEVNRQTGQVRVTRVCVSHDCGQIVNPDGLANQIEGGVIQQTNFNTYAMVRTNESPLVDIVLVKSSEKPGGIGEPVTATIVPALANAVAKLTGKRVRNLPITGKAIQEA
jgi:CO/xanthine dehydrogenase Mo-binding subunit